MEITFHSIFIFLGSICISQMLPQKTKGVLEMDSSIIKVHIIIQIIRIFYQQLLMKMDMDVVEMMNLNSTILPQYA